MSTQPKQEIAKRPGKDRKVLSMEMPKGECYLPLAGRILFSSIFLASAPRHLTRAYIDYAKQQGVPFPKIAVPLSGLIALAGGLSVLLGYRPRIGAGLLASFLVPVTSLMHRFWAEEEPLKRQEQMAHFMKNAALVGATMMVAHFGSGPMSIEKQGR